jgi:hypothetical protein
MEALSEVGSGWNSHPVTTRDKYYVPGIAKAKNRKVRDVSRNACSACIGSAGPMVKRAPIAVEFAVWADVFSHR